MARGDFKTDVTCGLENLPVFVDTGGASGGDGWRKFKYSPENVSGPGAALDPSEITFPGCDCLSSSCQLDSCLCLQRHGSAYTDDLRLTSSATRQEAGFSKPLFECNIMCKCGDSCKNRVVQRGLAYRFEVFETELKGCGLRTLEPIPQGSFVCEYAGEVLSSAEAHGRLRRQSPSDMNYIIAVKEHVRCGQVMETFVDPTALGNVGRFLNHSCQPNLFMVPVRVNSLVPRLALFAGCDIPANEELTFDYSGRYRNSEGSNFVPEEALNDIPRKPCYCSSKTCNGFLPFDISL